MAIKSFDTNPDSISTQMTRRDEIEGDLAGIFFDSYHDKRTGFGFYFQKRRIIDVAIHAARNLGFCFAVWNLERDKKYKAKNSPNVMPYLVARTKRFEKDAENPFLSSGKNNGFDVGFDAKIGLTNYLTMDLTINPDFGQVEADPLK